MEKVPLLLAAEPHHEQPKALDVNNIPLQNQSTVSNGMRFPKPKLQSGKES